MDFTPANIIGAVCAVNTAVFVLLVLDRKRKNPEKSYKNCVINYMLWPMRAMKLGPYKSGDLTFDGAVKYATKKTGYSDFGDDEFNFAKTYKTVLSNPIQSIQQYTNLGYISARIELNMTMVRRLRFIQYLKDVPEVQHVRVHSPVFVMGLPRTGTTLLHRLLSLDTKEVRAPLLWELLAPVPDNKVHNASSEEMTKDRSKRANFVRKLMDTRKDMGDKAIEHIHEVGWDLPEECIMALSDEIPCLVQHFYSAYMDPDVTRPLLKENMVKAYTHYKKYLQLLSWQVGEDKDKDKNPPRKWMLKCPVHLFYPKEIATAFPDAKLIWTHRHPISAVPSMCSLLKSFHKLYYEEEGRDDAALGKTLLRVSEDLLTQAPKDIKDCGLPCAHITYNRLLSEPVVVVKEIYAQFGWSFSKEYEQKLTTFLAEDKINRQKVKERKMKESGNSGSSNNNKGGAMHSYTPEEFGITAEELSSGRYKDYIDKFNIQMSAN